MLPCEFSATFRLLKYKNFKLELSFLQAAKVVNGLKLKTNPLHKIYKTLIHTVIIEKINEYNNT